jgi:Spy/CpxP family protein refolding chaperone
VVATVPLVVTAQAGPGRHGGGGPVGGGPHGLGFFDHALPRLAEELELTDEQLTHIEAIVDDARPAIEGYVEQLREARESYLQANDDPTVFDEGAFRSHAEAQQELQTELMVLVQKTKATVFQQLTAAQLEELESLRDDSGRRPRRHSKSRRW